MKRRAVLASTFILYVMTGGCYSEKLELEPGHGPLVSLDAGHIDFGAIDEGRAIAATFMVMNATDGPITIDGVRSGCGCTVPQLDKADLDPGEQIPVVVEFNSKHKPGDQKQVVTVYYFVGDDTAQNLQLLDLTLTGHVRSQLSRSANRISFGTVKVGEEYVQELTYSSEMYPEFEIGAVTPGDSQLAAHTSRVDERSIKVTVTLRPSADTVEHNSTLTVDLVNNPVERLNIPVLWDHFLPVTITPPSISGQRLEEQLKTKVVISRHKSLPDLPEFTPRLKFPGGSVQELHNNDTDARVFELSLPRSEHPSEIETGYLELLWAENDTYVAARVPIALYPQR